MGVHLRLFSLCTCLLLTFALFPGAQYTYAERGSRFWNRGKAKNNKESQSQSHGLSKHGLKWAGAAAAGILGGTGTGYGLGFLGKTKHKPGSHKTSSSHHHYYNQSQGVQNQSRWRSFVNAATPSGITNIGSVVGYVMPVIIAAWIRDI